MLVNVLFFASLREVTGRPSETLDLAEGATVEDAWQALVGAHPGLAPRRAHVAASVDRRYAPFDTALTSGSELVFIPPVSGG